MTDYHVPAETAIPVANAMEECPQTFLTDEMKETYSLSKTTKFLCGIDFVFSLIFACYNPYFFIPVIISMFGYWGAKNYKLCPIFFYLIYSLCYLLTQLCNQLIWKH